MLFNFAFVSNQCLESHMGKLTINKLDTDYDCNCGHNEVVVSGTIHTAQEVRSFEQFFKTVDFNLLADILLFVSEDDELPITSLEQLLDFLDTY